MKTVRLLPALLLLFICANPGTVCAQESILENYILGLGQNSDGIAVALSDKYFGGGTARAAIAFADGAGEQNPEVKSGSLVINVWRTVRAGEITFALLCFGVQVRGFNAEGAQVYSRDLPAFTFGDSQGGHYMQTAGRIPLSVAKLKITFFGNYE